MVGMVEICMRDLAVNSQMEYTVIPSWQNGIE